MACITNSFHSFLKINIKLSGKKFVSKKCFTSENFRNTRNSAAFFVTFVSREECPTLATVEPVMRTRYFQKTNIHKYFLFVLPFVGKLFKQNILLILMVFKRDNKWTVLQLLKFSIFTINRWNELHVQCTLYRLT